MTLKKLGWLAAPVAVLALGWLALDKWNQRENSAGPAHGWLLAAGGGHLDDSVFARFLELAGGRQAPIVVIPTASEDEEFGPDWEGLKRFQEMGATRLSLLHTRDRKLADSDSFTAPLREARGVWFSGGRQWRLVDSYLDTRTQEALRGVLERGGVVGGTSAGATILGSYLVRGAREGNTIMMAPGYEEGFGFLRDSAIDQHLLRRGREYDLLEVVQARPELLGIGLDEGAAIVVHGNRFEVIGRSNVAIYDIGFIHGAREAPFYFLSVGNAFNLKTRRPETPAAAVAARPFAGRR